MNYLNKVLLHVYWIAFGKTTNRFNKQINVVFSFRTSKAVI